MANWKIAALVSGLAAGAVLAMPANAPAFNIKPGLWEMTLSSSGMRMPAIPPSVLARMTPEQRRNFEAAMQAARARGLAQRLTRECITADALRRLPNFAPKEWKACRKTILKQTATDIALRLVCSGGPNLEGTIRYLAPNSKTLTGSVDLTTRNGAHPMRIRDRIRGKWLGSDCGAVKPRAR